MFTYKFRVYLENRTFDTTATAVSPSTAQAMVEAQYNCKVVCMGRV